MPIVPFSPPNLPLPDGTVDWVSLVSLAGRANQALGRFDGCLEGVINPGVLTSPLTTREAVLSARIEGTVTTMGDVLRYQADGVEVREQVDEIREIVNYRRALLAATEELQQRPLSLQVVRSAHSILLDSVRGSRTKGNFRTGQNYIAPFGAPIEEATYIPPDPVFLNDHLERFESYLSYTERDPVIQTAILHAQFELIHPFEDGNGRLGRMLIPLFLHWKGVLKSPAFYLSEYFDENHDKYVSRLRAISEDGDWNGRIAFFLESVAVQAGRNIEKARGIHHLYEETKRELDKMHSGFSMRVLDALFYLYAFSSPRLIDYTDIPRDSALRLIRELKARGLLKVIQEKSGNRPAVVAFAPLVNLVEGKQII